MPEEVRVKVTVTGPALLADEVAAFLGKSLDILYQEGFPASLYAEIHSIPPPQQPQEV